MRNAFPPLQEKKKKKVRARPPPFEPRMANVRYAQPKRALDHPHLSHVWQMLGMPNLGARSAVPI